MASNHQEPKAENFIRKLNAQLATHGLQRSNRFIVIIHGPGIEWVSGIENQDLIPPLGIDYKQRLALNCTDVTLPGKSISTIEFNPIGGSPTTRFPYAMNFTNELTISFNTSLDFFERKYFSGWNSKIIDTTTYEAELYEKYAKNWKILIVMLPSDVGSFDSIHETFENTDSRISYTSNGEGINNNSFGIRGEKAMFFIRVNECYPVEIMESNLSSSSQNELHKTTIKFNYRDIIDPVSAYIKELHKNKNNQNNIDLINGRDNINGSNAGGSFAIAGGVEYFPNSRDVGEMSNPEQGPFERFLGIAREILRYSDPAEAKRLLIENGVGALNDTLGEGVVNNISSSGQVLSVFSQSPNRNSISTIQNRLLGPLSNNI